MVSIIRSKNIEIHNLKAENSDFQNLIEHLEKFKNEDTELRKKLDEANECLKKQSEDLETRQASIYSMYDEERHAEYVKEMYKMTKINQELDEKLVKITE